MFIIFAVSFCWPQQMLTWQWGLLWFILKDIQKCWIFVEFFPIKVLSHFLLPTIMLTRYSKVHIQFTNNCFEEWNIYASRHNEHWLHFIFTSNHMVAFLWFWCYVKRINLWKNYFYEEHCLTTSNFHLHLTSSRVLTYWEYYLM